MYGQLLFMVSMRTMAVHAFWCETPFSFSAMLIGALVCLGPGERRGP